MTRNSMKSWLESTASSNATSSTCSTVVGRRSVLGVELGVGIGLTRDALEDAAGAAECVGVGQGAGELLALFDHRHFLVIAGRTSGGSATGREIPD